MRRQGADKSCASRLLWEPCFRIFRFAFRQLRKGSRLIGQMVTESVTLALMGGAMGAVLGLWASSGAARRLIRYNSICRSF